MRIIGSLIIIILCLLTVAFALLNAEQVSINYLLGERQLPLSLLVILVLLTGILLGIICSFRWIFSIRRKSRLLTKQVQDLRTEIDTLRAMPVKDSHLWS